MEWTSGCSRANMEGFIFIRHFSTFTWSGHLRMHWCCQTNKRLHRTFWIESSCLETYVLLIQRGIRWWWFLCSRRHNFLLHLLCMLVGWWASQEIISFKLRYLQWAEASACLDSWLTWNWYHSELEIWLEERSLLQCKIVQTFHNLKKEYSSSCNVLF